MTTKQKKVYDYLIMWAENEVRLGNSTNEGLAEYGPMGMDDFGGAMFNGVWEAGYSHQIVDDAAYGGNKTGYSYKILEAVEEAFKEHFKNKR